MSSSSQDEYNWNYVAFEMDPTANYSDVYQNQPRIYMFEGATTLDLCLLVLGLLLALFWLLLILKSPPTITRALISITVTQIVLNSLVRAAKCAFLLLEQYPQLTWLFVATSVETTFHYTLYLQYTSSVLVYVWLRQRENGSGKLEAWTTFYYLPSLLVGAIISTLNVNFNSSLYSIPFFCYVIFYVGMAGSNVVILVAIFTSCTKLATRKLIRLRLFLFVLVASPPVLFNTVISIMDLLFMAVGISEQLPIPYIWMTVYRYKAFEATPVFILTAFFALFPDLKRPRTISTAEVTAIVTEPPTVLAAKPAAVPSAAPPAEPDPPLPNSIEAPAPPIFSNPYGSLVVHIQPFRNM